MAAKARAKGRAKVEAWDVRPLFVPIIKEMRLRLYDQVRADLYKLLPEKMVESLVAEDGTRCVRVGALAVTCSPTGVVSVLDESNRFPFAIRNYQDSLRNLRQSFKGGDKTLSGHLHCLLECAHEVVSANNGSIEALKDAIQVVITENLPEINRRLTLMVELHPEDRMRALATIGLRKWEDEYPGPNETVKAHQQRIVKMVLDSPLDGRLAFGLAGAAHWTNDAFAKVRIRGGGAWGLTAAMLGRHGMKQIAGIMDREAWELTWRSAPHGRETSMTRLNLVGEHRELYKQVMADSPRLFKLHSITFERFLNKRQAKAWAKHPKDAVQTLQAFWRERGMTASAWKLLHRLDPFQREACHASIPYKKRKEGAFWAVLMTRAAALNLPKIPRGFWSNAKSIPIEILGMECDWAVPVVDIMLRELVRLSKVTPAEKAKWAEYPINRFSSWAGDISDYLRHVLEGEAAMPPVPKGAGGRWLEAQSEVWHREMLAASLARTEEELVKLEAIKWSMPLAEFTREEHVVVGLSNGRQLIEEGLAMLHCVGDYIAVCKKGDSRIFSIREKATGTSLATVELVPSDQERGQWRLRQARIVKNHLVPHGSELAQTVTALLQAWNEVVAKKRKPARLAKPA